MPGLIEAAVERVLMGDQSPQTDHDSGTLHKIVVCQRGFVYAGDVRREGSYIVVTNAVNVRKWGTKNGLGELAEHGNLPETKCDATGTVRVHELAVVNMIDCEGRIRATT